MRAWVTGFVLAALVAAPAAAHDDDRRGDRSYGGHRSDAYGIGYDNGYEDGLRHGRSDGRRGLDFAFAHDGRYRRGDAGYRSHYGSRHVYADGFRSGYREGYGDGYRVHRGGHGQGYGSSGYGSYAYDDGYAYAGDVRSAKRKYGEIYDWRANGRHRHRGGSGFCIVVH